MRTTVVVLALVAFIQVAALATRWSHNRRVAHLGDRLFFETYGNGDPVLLLHGLRGSGSYWSGLAQSMAGSPYRLIVPDLLGFGRSPWPVIRYSVDDHVDAIDQSVRNTLSKKPVIVVGHSMGAILAVEYAIRHPSQVRGLVLMNAPMFESEAEARKRIREMSPMAAAFSLNQVLARASCDVVCAARPLLWHLAPALERSVPPEVARHGLLHRWESFDGSLQRVVLPARLDQTLRSIDRIPVIFIHGESDPVAEVSRVRRVAATIGAGVNVVSGGHNILLEHPAETSRAVREAIDALNSSAP